MRETIDGRRPIKDAIRPTLVALIALIAACLILASCSSGSSTQEHKWNKGQQRYEQVLPASSPAASGISPEFNPTHSLETLISDEATGVRVGVLSPVPSEGDSNSGESALPQIDSLVVIQGEGCLHEEGACDACDAMRGMLRSGELDGLFRIAMEPEGDVEGEFVVSFPVNAHAQKVMRYWCDNGTLKSAPETVARGVIQDVSIDSSFLGIQSPVGYVVMN